MTIIAPISAGELIDKITILSIKSKRILDTAKLENVHMELNALRIVAERSISGIVLKLSIKKLMGVNDSLWHVEDEIREYERRSDFGAQFIELARSVYSLNDRRCRMKREIDELVGSDIVEEKSHTF